VTKSRRTIAAQDVARVFDDECIRKLACELPKGGDIARFGQPVREAARVYARDARRPTDNEVRDEIGALYRVASRSRYEQLAKSIEDLSPRARWLLDARGALPSVGISLPPPDALRDLAKKNAARTSVLKLCQHGGGWVKGRRRPSGKRSRGWQPLLHAPRPQKHPPKRDAERYFVILLQLAWNETVGEPPACTAHPDNPGPFARLVKECLKLVGATCANAVELINKVHQQRRELRRRSDEAME
jgi:hypothetical protein